MKTTRLNAFRKIMASSLKSWFNHEPLRESAVIAYFAIFSIPALLVLVLNFASLFMDRRAINSEIGRQIKSSIGPSGAEELQKAVERAGDLKEGTIATILGVLIILFGATRVFIHLKKTFNEIWGVRVRRKPFWRGFLDSIFSIGIILAIGFLLLMSMVLSTILTAGVYWLQQVIAKEVIYIFQVIEVFFSLGLVTLLFALMYRFLPDVKITWREVFPGALVAGVLFTGLKYAISLYFVRSEPFTIYGKTGTAVLVLIWVAVCSMIVFLGAEYNRQFAKYHGIEVKPKKDAEKRQPMNDDDE